MAKLMINKNKKEGTIAPEIYGHFSEHLGRCIYEGLYVGENSEIPNVNGMRTDVEFRMWENHAESRIVAAIENAYDTYYYRKENQAYEEENDSIVAASSLVVPARRVWQG
mgnify:CR=1 FL=1